MEKTHTCEIENYFKAASDIAPMEADRWLLSSAMQKAIRRGHAEIALSAGLGLWKADRNNFWRRLHIAALEDVSVGDTGAVTACLKIYLDRSSGDKQRDLASGLYVINLLCGSLKSRSADELYLIAANNPVLLRQKAELSAMNSDELTALVNTSPDLIEKALALWTLAGTNRFPSDNMPRRRGDDPAVISAVSGIVCEEDLKTTCCGALYKTQWPLALFTPLIAQAVATEGDTRIEEADVYAPLLCHGLPFYAADMFTRLGKLCIRIFMHEVRDLRQFSTSEVGKAVFYLEGGILDKRLTSPMLDELRSASELADIGATCLGAPECLGLKDLVRKNFSVLNAVREKQIIRYMEEFRGGLL